MAKTSVYLPDDLAEEARACGIPISEVTQAAVRQAVKDAQIKENVMTDIQAVADRLRATRAADAEAERAKAARARACGVRWARTAASADELESMVTYAGPPLDYRTPVSVVTFVSGEHQREHRALGGVGLPGPTDLPTGPGDRYWPDFLAGAREVWDAVQPLLMEIGEHGESLPPGSGGYAEKVNPEYQRWLDREPAGAGHAQWAAEEPPEFL